MDARCDCTAEATSVRRARLFVVDKLQEWGRDELVDTAALLTSELATNAVVHTGRPYSVRVGRRRRGIRVEVADSAPEPPHLKAPLPLDGTSEVGHLDGSDASPERLFSGLGMVDAVAARWGSDPAASGKVVWFELDGAEGDDRARLSDLSDLRSPEPVTGWNVTGLNGDGAGKGEGNHPPQEDPTMARRLVDDDDRLIEEREVRYIDDDRRGGGAMRWILALLVIAALAIGAFFLFGGSADVDTEGDLQVPKVDVDVNAPNVDVDSEEAPPASADAGTSDADASNG